MEQKPYKLTGEGLKQLRARIHELENKAEEISKQRAEAAGMGGDWHDNFAFEQFIRDEQMLGQQIKESRKLLARAVVVDDEIQGEKIKIGISVEIEFENGGKERFVLTDPEAINPSRNIISYASPLGKAILVAREGDVRTYFVKEKKFQVKIIRIGEEG